MTASKLVLNAASGASGDPLNIENVFSTFTYYGNGGTGQSIVNGIDLSGEGGLVWFKQRNATRDHGLFDTARGATKYVVANETNGEATSGTTLTAFNSNGFTLGGGGGIVNNGSGEYVSWTFRKAKKFFDIVTYTGSGSHPRNVSHNLGSVPGMILVKNLSDGTEDWIVYHRGVDSSAPEDYGMFLNLTDAAVNNDAYWGDTAPTSTNFTVGGNITNQSGQNFIAYLFAHNNNDGDFGPDGDKDIIKCGGYTGNGASGLGTFQDLGFEPQWIMVKNTDLSSEGWVMLDNMRGVSGPGSNDPRVTANSNNQEYNGAIMQFSATGFTPVSADDKINGSGHAYIYMAIRRGPMATPEDATKVFAIGERGQNSPPLLIKQVLHQTFY